MALLAWAVMTSPAWAVERRTWVNDQIAHTVFRPSKALHLYSFLSSTAYQDSINALGSVQWDPGPAEIRVFGGGRAFLGLTAEGRAELAALANERLFYGFELGRSYYHRQSGALRLGWIQFPQANLGFVTVGIETSHRVNTNAPWFFRLLISYWINVMGKRTVAGGDSLNLSLEINRVTEGQFLGITAWGVAVSTIFRSPEFARLPAGRYDVVSFGISPTAKWSGTSGNWEASLDFRVFLDSEQRTGLPTSNPSVLAVPGVSVRWGQPQ